MTNNGSAYRVVRDFQFGVTMIENVYASDDNPHKRGIYVRTIRRNGRMNPGLYVELTDGKGEFWTVPIEAVEKE